MAFIKIECMQDSMEAVVFNSIYEKCKEKLILDKPYVFIGKTSFREGRMSIILDDLKSFNNFKPSITYGNKSLILDISREKNPVKLKILKQTIMDNPGDYKLTVYYLDKNGKKQKKELKKRIRLNSVVKNIIEDYMKKD